MRKPQREKKLTHPPGRISVLSNIGCDLRQFSFSIRECVVESVVNVSCFPYFSRPPDDFVIMWHMMEKEGTAAATATTAPGAGGRGPRGPLPPRNGLYIYLNPPA